MLTIPGSSPRGAEISSSVSSASFGFLQPGPRAPSKQSVGSTRISSKSSNSLEDDLSDIEDGFDERMVPTFDPEDAFDDDILPTVRRAWESPEKVVDPRRLRKVSLLSKAFDGDVSWRPFRAVPPEVACVGRAALGASVEADTVEIMTSSTSSEDTQQATVNQRERMSGRFSTPRIWRGFK